MSQKGSQRGRRVPALGSPGSRAQLWRTRPPAPLGHGPPAPRLGSLQGSPPELWCVGGVAHLSSWGHGASLVRALAREPRPSCQDKQSARSCLQPSGAFTGAATLLRVPSGLVRGSRDGALCGWGWSRGGRGGVAGTRLPPVRSSAGDRRHPSSEPRSACVHHTG